MSQPFTTTCPHCGEQVDIAYDDLSRHLHKEMGRLSASKRKDLKNHLTAMNQRRWHNYEHPKQAAPLALAQSEDLSSFPMSEIATKLGITGPYRGVYIKRLIHHLQKKGLLPHISLGGRQAKQQAILDLIQAGKGWNMTLKEIADKVGYTSPHREKYVRYHIKQLQKNGLLSKS